MEHYMRMSKKRKEYLLENYPIDTTIDLEFFDNLDKWLDKVEQRYENNKYIIIFPDGVTGESNMLLDKNGLVGLYNDLDK